jgi:hypothetical protein
MKMYNLTWDANACGIPATYFSIHFRREVVDRFGNQKTDYSAEDVVNGGEVLEPYYLDTEYFVTLFGQGNTFALVAHNDTESSAPKILAKNINGSGPDGNETGELITTPLNYE